MARRAFQGMAVKTSVTVATCLVLGLASVAAGVLYYWKKRKDDAEEEVADGECEKQPQAKDESKVDDGNVENADHAENEDKSNKENVNSEDPYGHLKNQGNELFREQKYEEAIEKYLQCLKHCKGAKENELRAIVYQNLSAAYDNLENLDEATKYANLSLKENPNYTKAIARLGSLKSKLGEHQEAVECFWKVLKENNHAPIQKSFEDSLRCIAASELQSALKAHNVANISNHVVKRYFNSIVEDPIINAAKNVSDETASESGLGMDEDDESNGSSGSIEAINRKTMTSLLRLVKKYKYDEAYQYAKELVENSYENLNPDNKALILNFIGSVESAMGFHDEAYKRFCDIANLNAQDISETVVCNAHLKMIASEISHSMCDFDDMKSELRKLIDKYPNNPDVYLNVYQMFLIEENLGPDANDLLIKAQELSHGHPFCELQVLYHSIRTFNSTDITDLFEMMEQLKAMATEKTSVVRSFAQQVYVETLLQLGRLEMAQKFINDLLDSEEFKANPDPFILCTAAEVDFSLDIVDGGIAKVDRAIKVDPFFDKAHFLKISTECNLNNSDAKQLRIYATKFAECCPRSTLLTDAFQYVHVVELKSKFPSST